MEQQNQQPQQNTQSQPPLSSPKKGIFNTKFKLFFIVALVAVILAIGGILLLRGTTPAPVVQTPSPASAPALQPQTLKMVEQVVYTKVAQSDGGIVRELRVTNVDGSGRRILSQNILDEPINNLQFFLRSLQKEVVFLWQE